MCRAPLLLAVFFLVSCIPVSRGTLKFNGGKVRSPASEAVSVDELQMSDRHYVESVLDRAFAVKGSADEAIVKAHTLNRFEFGGGCDRMEASEINGNMEFPDTQCFSGLQSNTTANSTAGRYSLTIRICEHLVSTQARMDSFLAKVYGSNSDRRVNETAVKSAYRLFYVETNPDQKVLAALMSLAGSKAPDEAWQDIAFVLCSSPEWQAL